MNHPKLAIKILRDLDVDGKTWTKGFRGMLQNGMDVDRSPSTETNFRRCRRFPPNVNKMRNPLFNGCSYSIRHVFQASSIRRPLQPPLPAGSAKWFACSHDDPAQITIDEMMRTGEAGHFIIMSSGPFLSVEGNSRRTAAPAIPGDDLVTRMEKSNTDDQRPKALIGWTSTACKTVHHGRPSEEHNYTRKKRR